MGRSGFPATLWSLAPRRKRRVIRLVERTAGLGCAERAGPAPAWGQAGGGPAEVTSRRTLQRLHRASSAPAGLRMASPGPGARAISLKPRLQLQRHVPGDKKLTSSRARRAPSPLVSVSLWSQHPGHFITAWEGGVTLAASTPTSRLSPACERSVGRTASLTVLPPWLSALTRPGLRDSRSSDSSALGTPSGAAFPTLSLLRPREDHPHGCDSNHPQHPDLSCSQTPRGQALRHYCEALPSPIHRVRHAVGGTAGT